MDPIAVNLNINLKVPDEILDAFRTRLFDTANKIEATGEALQQLAPPATEENKPEEEKPTDEQMRSLLQDLYTQVGPKALVEVREAHGFNLVDDLDSSKYAAVKADIEARLP